MSLSSGDLSVDSSPSGLARSDPPVNPAGLTKVRAKRFGGVSMSTIDKQRIAAVRKLEELGYAFTGSEWRLPAHDTIGPVMLSSDALYALIVKRADALAGCTEGSEEEHELAAISDAIEAYVAVRWPDGRTEGGKG
jgi:hypothetical protein